MRFTITHAILFCVHLVLSLANGCVVESDTTQVIYSYPKNPFTNIENIAVRSNGQLLLNCITSPTTYLLDIAESPPSLGLLLLLSRGDLNSWHHRDHS